MRGSALTEDRSRSWLNRLPWGLVVVIGLVCTAIGLVIVFRPFTSLSVLTLLIGLAMIATGIARLGEHERFWGTWSRWFWGVAWIVAGVVVLAWPNLSIQALAWFVGIAMIVDGIVEIASAFRGTTDERLASGIGGLASVVFGVLAVSWPDVTLLVVAVVFGARTVFFGLRLIYTAIRDRDHSDISVPETPSPKGWFRRFAHMVGVSLLLLLAIGLASVSASLHAGVPSVDEFYSAPDDLPAEPGVLLRVEPFTVNIPSNADAWRILYTTTRGEDVPAVASALVVAPEGSTNEPRPVIAWAHGTTGVARTCAPSVMATGLEAGAFFSLDRVLEEGWVLVATDYVGLGTEGPHPYLIGQGEARSVLDAVRAAKQMDEVSLADQTVVWGHSQGGGAALWTGQLAPSYAPDADVIGVAALAPASDLIGLVTNLGNVTGGSIFATFVLNAYADTYDDVTLDDYVRPTARVTFEETASRCLDATAIVSALSSVATGMDVFSRDLTSGPFAARLEENLPSGPFEMPLLIGQGEADTLVLPDVQAAYVDGLCTSGQDVDFRTYPGRDHVPLVQPDSPLIPQLVAWTQDRLAGRPAASTCGAE